MRRVVDSDGVKLSDWWTLMFLGYSSHLFGRKQRPTPDRQQTEARLNNCRSDTPEPQTLLHRLTRLHQRGPRRPGVDGDLKHAPELRRLPQQLPQNRPQRRAAIITQAGG